MTLDGKPSRSELMPPRDFARHLRRESTAAERLLWRHLRGRALGSRKFRRQHPVPPYCLDFCCLELKLAIEIDGGQHATPEGMIRDVVRSQFLKELGFEVVRFSSRDVLLNPDGVVEAILEAITKRAAGDKA